MRSFLLRLRGGSAAAAAALMCARLAMPACAQETLIVARHSLWQQNFVRIQHWLRSSEAISMDAAQNRDAAQEAGYLDFEQPEL